MLKIFKSREVENKCIQVFLLDSEFVPRRHTKKSVGIDLCVREKCLIFPGDCEYIDFGVVVIPPVGCFFYLFGRSSLNLNGQIFNIGPIALNKRETIKTRVLNVNPETVFFLENDRIAQLVCLSYCRTAEIELKTHKPLVKFGTSTFSTIQHSISSEYMPIYTIFGNTDISILANSVGIYNTGMIFEGSANNLMILVHITEELFKIGIECIYHPHCINDEIVLHLLNRNENDITISAGTVIVNVFFVECAAIELKDRDEEQPVTCLGLCEVPSTSNITIVTYKLDTSSAIAPKFCNVYSHESSIGFYLFAKKKISIATHSVSTIDTGITLSVKKEGYYIQLYTPFVLARIGIEILGGVIDPDYNGTIKAIVYNSTNNEFTVSSGDFVAFACVLKYESPDVEQLLNCQCENMNVTRCCCESLKLKVRMEHSERGSGGFGSTNVYKSS